MKRLVALLAVAILATATVALGQDTPTPTETATPTHTHTPTHTPTNTPTVTPTNTPNVTLKDLAGSPGRLTAAQISDLVDFAPGAKRAGFDKIVRAGVRQVRLPATNATALGLRDVRVVTSIVAFVAADGAPATKALLAENVDFTVVNGDVIPAGDSSAQIWVITYRP